MTTLIIAAHPDDEVLGCGGTIARLAAQGEDVGVLILTRGDSGRNPDKEAIASQAKEAAKTLGATLVKAADFPDQRLDCVPLAELAILIAEIIAITRPHTVYTHFAGDLNQDHRLVFQATAIATRTTENCLVKRLYSYQVPSSTEWAFGQLGAFTPNTFVDIAGGPLKAKLEAMKLYLAENMEYPHPRIGTSIKCDRSSVGVGGWAGSGRSVYARTEYQLNQEISTPKLSFANFEI